MWASNKLENNDPGFNEGMHLHAIFFKMNKGGVHLHKPISQNLIKTCNVHGQNFQNSTRDYLHELLATYKISSQIWTTNKYNQACFFWNSNQVLFDMRRREFQKPPRFWNSFFLKLAWGVFRTRRFGFSSGGSQTRFSVELQCFDQPT